MPSRRSIITLGSFDGVHRGHAALLSLVVRRARALGAVPGALVFGIPPRFAARPSGPCLLTLPEEKHRLLRALGIRRLQTLSFDRRTSAMSAESFFERTVVRRHRALEMVVGPRLAFGKNRAGRLPLLRGLGRRFGVRIHVVRSVAAGRSVVSSTRIREDLSRGRVEQAARALGRPYSVEGRVVHGDGRGRRLGIPTANIAVDPRKVVPYGVFAVRVRPLNRVGVCNIGHRPTFEKGGAARVEVHLLGAPLKRSLYGRHLRVEFLKFLRPERRFEGPAALGRQIQSDIRRARRLARAMAGAPLHPSDD